MVVVEKRVGLVEMENSSVGVTGLKTFSSSFATGWYRIGQIGGIYTHAAPRSCSFGLGRPGLETIGCTVRLDAC